MSHGLLWVPFTLAAAFAQVLRNAAQSRLTGRIGTVGGTQVRFVYGLPFAAILLAIYLAVTSQQLPAIPAETLAWAVVGSVTQIVATALMLVVMTKRDFGVAYAYIKTEPVTVALLGLVLIGDRLSWLGWVAVVIVTIGVVLASLRVGDKAAKLTEWKPLVVGVASGALFGLSAICFRASIDLVPQGGFMLRSLTMLVVSLAIQSATLAIWFVTKDASGFFGSLREWRLSVVAGALGAIASAGWFISFSLTLAANVRTLALIEMPVVAVLSRYVSGRWLTAREWVGFVLITVGVALLMLAHAA
ncbi:EamA family transporter [Novosphingobium mangrovi (ex Huang et al. 2023)]|uniref:EamA family transporter n=1 Tax=Novosphingobium mangrovi (ex Huang et al. 2023) TaxID=2976432 RepID=A0ABT2I3R2_9SPHN|nr:EamA family transporter [Novosphingobium mangrovi (ex Huang et al. 2023)]MCT2399446.1 EamA family transporter [Novosphingobium mangrovi (ex Huang et al. 2023)]